MLDSLETASAERAHLRRQVMIGYALFHATHAWNGVVYQRLARAQDAAAWADPDTEVVLVHTTGTLYYQSSGDAIGRVLLPGGKTVHLPVHRHQRSQRNRLRQSAQARQARKGAAVRAPSTGRGFTHLAYVD